MSQINSNIKDDFQVVFDIVMFRGTPCIIRNRGFKGYRGYIWLVTLTIENRLYG